jgi:hypothetical protein
MGTAYIIFRDRDGSKRVASAKSVMAIVKKYGYGTSRTSRDVRLESAKWARADIDH